jgi:pimeloyl-ACP methyl ester carboxylesterase
VAEASSKKNIKNYDYTSIKETIIAARKDTIKVKELWIDLRDRKKQFSRMYPSAKKDVMILIHGSGSESRYLKRMAMAIADSNIATVITPDLRGHGQSDGTKGDIDYVGQLEDDIEDLIAYSKNILGAKKIILAGHSSGGGLVLRYIANAQNTKIDKALMLAPYLGHKAPTVKPNSGNWVTVAVKRWVGLSMLNGIGISTFDRLPVLFFNRPETYNDKLQAPSYSYRMAVNFGPKNYKTDIENISVPTLVLVGRNDESFYPGQFKIVFEPAQKFVKTEMMDEANHLNIVSSNESVNRIIEWLRN